MTVLPVKLKQKLCSRRPTDQRMGRRTRASRNKGQGDGRCFSYLEALVAVEVGPLELLDPLLHDLLRQQRHRHLCSPSPITDKQQQTRKREARNKQRAKERGNQREENFRRRRSGSYLRIGEHREEGRKRASGRGARRRRLGFGGGEGALIRAKTLARRD